MRLEGIEHKNFTFNSLLQTTLTVSEEGLVLNPIVIEEKPKGKKFGKQALKAASSLRYIPRFEDGEPVEVPGVLFKYTFKMAR